MKKLLVLSLALLMVLSLVSCGKNATNTVSSSASISSAESASTSTSTSKSAAGSTSASEKKSKSGDLGMSATEYEKNMKKEYDGFPGDPASKEGKNDDGSKYTQYMYTLDDSFDVHCFENSDGKLYSIMVMGMTDDINTQNIKGDFYRVAMITVALFEPKDDILSTIDSSLDLENSLLTDGTLNTADGSIANFTYSVGDGMATLYVDAN